jgi:putative intracellular protease/amidase
MKTILLLPVVGFLMSGQAPSLLAATNSSGASPLPVLLVIANQDFYYREYSDTRSSLEASGLAVRVAAATTTRCLPASGTGQPASAFGGVIPDLPLAKAQVDDYSAIVFVGGWGSSMYQYAYNDPNLDGAVDSLYANALYNGDDNLGDGKVGETKIVVNNLINDFVAQDKYVSGICHGVSVLAWARVDGASPLAGKKVVATVGGTPATYYLGEWYADNQLSLHEQIVANGGFSSPYSGQMGNPTTAADDVIVDGRIITAEDYTSAKMLGRVIAGQVLSPRF